jgi:hypothetical protein
MKMKMRFWCVAMICEVKARLSSGKCKKKIILLSLSLTSKSAGSE